jgi:two-component SAPR family response regulator
MGQFASRRVLVVDDEFLIAMDIEMMLSDMGMQVVGPATTLKAALELAETETIDCAILDVDLGDGDFVTPVVNTLIARQIPFALATGYISWSGEVPLANAIRVPKPFTVEQMQEAVQSILC